MVSVISSDMNIFDNTIKIGVEMIITYVCVICINYFKTFIVIMLYGISSHFPLFIPMIIVTSSKASLMSFIVTA